LIEVPDDNDVDDDDSLDALKPHDVLEDGGQ
jgi:hypothetical protein